MRSLQMLALILLAAGNLLAGGQNEAAGDEFAIGYLGSITGNLANYGTLQSQAAKLALADFQQANPEVDVKLVIEDSAGQSDRAAQAVDKMIGVDKIVALIGPVISGVGLAVAPQLQQAEVVTISGSASAADFTGVGDYIFRTQVSDAVQANVMGRYVYRELGLETMAVLYTENDYSQPLAERFKNVYEQAGGQVLTMESSLEGDKDFKTQLTKIRQLNPQGVFLPNYAVELAQMLRQARQLGLNAQFLSADGFSNPDTLALGQQDVLEVIFSGPATAEVGVDQAQMDDFIARYRQEYKVDPDNFSLNVYDATMMVLNAIQKVSQGEGGFSRAALRNEIQATKSYQGISGVIAFDAQGDVIKNQAILTTVADAQGQPKYEQIGLYKVVDDQLIKVN